MYRKSSKRYSIVGIHFRSTRQQMMQLMTIVSFAFLTILLSISIAIAMAAS